MVYQLESAQNRPGLHSEANWTATYRRDSTLAAPYGWWRTDDDDHMGFSIDLIAVLSKSISEFDKARCRAKFKLHCSVIVIN